MSALYSTKDIYALAADRGPFAVDKMRQALLWAARTLEAADKAVAAEHERAQSLRAAAMLAERERCARVCEAMMVSSKKPYTLLDAAAAIRARETT